MIFPQDSEADAFESEVALIEFFGRKDKGTGCLRNLTAGGDGVSGMQHSESAKQKISLALSGHPKTLGMTGRHHSDETKRKMRHSSQGQVPWSKGLQFSEEHKNNLRISATGRKMSAESVEKMAATKRGQPWSAARRKAHEDRYGKF